MAATAAPRKPTAAMASPRGTVPRHQAPPLDLRNALRGEITPVKKPWSYSVGIFLVTCVMIVLPLVYVGLIGLTAFGVYYHAVYHTGMLAYGSGRGKIFVLLAYLAPIVVGTISVLFMTKPLLARPAQQIRSRSLTRRSDPQLFDYVEQLCRTVGAPEPTRIDVDYDLNASARFRRGMRSFLGSDLVLTIGIPLAAGLTLRQFTGVLAHEFGHFSQGLGMRMTYVARSINAWFARVVYERDEWDEYLEETATEIDFRIGWILLLSQLFVLLSRGVLWVLMMVGHAVSGYMLRQMEYDADRYETRVAGSKTFAATTLRIRELAAGYQLAQVSIMDALSRAKFPDDLSKLMLKKLDEIPPQRMLEIRAAAEQASTGIFDTHPSDRDRIASSQREEAEGISIASGPASLLFSDFDTLSKNVTWDLYRALGAGIKPQEMDRVEDLFAEKQAIRPAPAIVDDGPIPFD